MQSLIIAVDFDGTIVDDAYPGIGKPKMFAFQTLKKMQENGHRLILWTYREGPSLDEAVAFCRSRYIESPVPNKGIDEAIELIDQEPREIEWKSMLVSMFLDHAVVEKEKNPKT